MIDVMYIKSPNRTNYYLANENFMEIISISKDYLFVMAEDEGMVEGAYKIIKVDERVFEEMKNLATNRKRKKLTEILQQVHDKNKEVLEDSLLQIRIEESRYDYDPRLIKQREKDLINYFNKTPAILD